MGNNKKKAQKVKKTKPKCCGKFRKKGKHCSRCPVILRAQCKLDTERAERTKKEEGKKKAKKKADKALSKKKVDKKKVKKKKKK